MSKLDYVCSLARYWAFSRIPPRPRTLKMEITNRCNLRCTFCDRSAMTRPTEAMDWDLFRKICRDAIRFGVPHIGLNRFGEPLLHPRLPDMVAFAKENGARFVEFVTNGTLLTEERARDLLRAGLDQIAVSVDGARRSTFEKVRVGASYDKVVGNLHRFLELRKELGSRTKVQLNYVVTRETIGEVGEYRRYWGTKVDHIYFIPFKGYASVHDLSPMPPPKRRTKCYMLWYMLVANVEGIAGICCHGDPNQVLNVGDLGARSVKDIWNGPEINRIRRIHFERRWKDLPICAGCDMIYPYTHWIKYYLKTYRHIYLGS